MPTKHVFVTGGVASSLGKGLTASSLGRLLRSRGLAVTMQKLDPYLNVDPETMNPFQHGEVFVTNDGTETPRHRSLRAVPRHRPGSGARQRDHGSGLSSVIAKERRGDYLGDTVRSSPHHQRDQGTHPRDGELGSPTEAQKSPGRTCWRWQNSICNRLVSRTESQTKRDPLDSTGVNSSSSAPAVRHRGAR